MVKRLGKSARKHRESVLIAFAGSDVDPAVAEVEIVDPEAGTFLHAEAGAIEESGHKSVNAGEEFEDASGLIV